MRSAVFVVENCLAVIKYVLYQKKTNTVKQRTVTAGTVALQCYRLEENILIIIVTDIDGTPESAAPCNDTN